MDIKTFISNFENAMENVTPGTITPSTRFRELEQWDSLSAMGIIAMLDSEYQVTIAPQEFRAFNTIEEVYNKVVLLKK